MGLERPVTSLPFLAVLLELGQAPTLQESELADEQLLEAIRRFHKLPQAPGTSG